MLIQDQVKTNNSYLKLIFNPRWELIEGVRDFLEEFTFTSIKKSSLAKATALATSELLENAVKFSSGNRISLELILNPETGRAGGTEVVINIENYARKNHVDRLTETLKDIQKVPPREAYLMKLKAAMDRGIEDAVSELGLARLQYEAYARYTLTVGKDDLVSLSVSIMENRE